MWYICKGITSVQNANDLISKFIRVDLYKNANVEFFKNKITATRVQKLNYIDSNNLCIWRLKKTDYAVKIKSKK